MIALKIAMRLCYNLPRHLHLAFVLSVPLSPSIIYHSFITCTGPEIVSFGARMRRLTLNKYEICVTTCGPILLVGNSKIVDDSHRTLDTDHKCLWQCDTRIRFHYACVRTNTHTCASCAYLIYFAFTRMKSDLRSAEFICII